MRFQALKQTAACILLLVFVAIPTSSLSQSDEPFEPVWHLLNREQKQQFIAAYLHGMRDAATLTSVLEGFLKENPNAGEASVQKLSSLYRAIGTGDAGDLTKKLDRFFNNPNNAQAPLSRAVTAVQ